MPAWLRALALPVLHRAALWRLRRLPPPRDDRAGRVLRAVELTLRGRPEADEREWIQRIERLRGELLASREPVTVADYGAGEAPASAGGMQRGDAAAQTVGERCRSSKSPFWALLLFRLVRELRPERCLELGTNCGISAAYQAAALRLNGAGELRTVEGSPGLVELSRRTLDSLDLAAAVVEGRFADVLPPLLEAAGPFDYVFVDGHHDGPATLAYFARLQTRLRNGALVVFDDIAWSEGMARAWRAIQADPRVRVAVDLGAMGVCVVDGEPGAVHRLRLPLRG